MTPSPPPSDDPYAIRPDEPAPFRIQLALENLTARMTIRDGRRFYADRPRDPEGQGLEILIEEFVEATGVALRVPARTASVGHRILLFIQTQNAPEGDLKFEQEGRVIEAISGEDGSDRLTLLLAKPEEGPWSGLLAKFAARQDDIDQFFETSRG